MHGLSRRVEWAALLGTIPAFYLAMLSSHRIVSVTLYLAAFMASAFVTWTDAVAADRHPASGRDRHGPRQLGMLLSLSLLLSALLPQGDQPDLLILRLGTTALVVLRWGDAFLPSSWRGGLPHLLGLGIGVFGLYGLGFWWLEPRVHTFGDGLWLAFTTAATVGYGDIVPSTPASKIFAVFVVLTGFAVLSLVTASIAAVWVQTEERKIEHEILRDLHRELRVVRDELAAMRREKEAVHDDTRRPASAPLDPPHEKSGLPS
jgi:voltage-gated potassium channel